MDPIARTTWLDRVRKQLAHGKSLLDTLGGSCFLWFKTGFSRSSSAKPPEHSKSTQCRPGLIDEKPPDGWEQNIHPNGAPYFFKRWKPCSVVTPDNLMEPLIHENLEQNITSLMEDASWHLPQGHDCELWLTLAAEDLEDFDHIFVDHTTREVFCCPKTGGVVKEGERSYWHYFSRAPMHHHLPDGAEGEMVLHLSHFAGERIMENVNTSSPFTLTQCEQLISLYETLEKEMPHTENPNDSGARIWFTSVVMLEICDRRSEMTDPKPDESRYPTWTMSALDWCLFVLCFGMHERYRLRLLHAQQNGGVHFTTFQSLLAGTLQEWTGGPDSNLLGTVFVSANMAFLAVPNIQRTQQTIVLVSTYFSIASVMVGIHHLWTHRPKAEADANETMPYLHRAAGDASSITLMSVFLCLPLVFLLWAVLSFFVALLHFAFRNYHGDSLIILVCISSVVIFATLCVLAYFYSIWDNPNNSRASGAERRALPP